MGGGARDEGRRFGKGDRLGGAMRPVPPVRAVVLCIMGFRRGGAREGFVDEEARCAEFRAGKAGGGMVSTSSESVNDGMLVETVLG